MRSFQSIILLIPVLLLIDLYAFKGITTLIKLKSLIFRRNVSFIYLAFSVIVIASFIFLYLNYQHSSEEVSRLQRILWYDAILVAIYTSKIVFIVFESFDDIVKGLKKLTHKRNYKEPPPPTNTAVSRRDFILKAGIIGAAFPFLGVLDGMGRGRFRFTVHHSEIKFHNLPQAFDGLRIVQLSDAHLGSLYGNADKFEEVTRLISEIKPDILVFTGDMVNNFASEMAGWNSVWTRMKAPMGKFAILGNHDYGDYSAWPTPAAKKANHDALIRQEEEMGFRVLLNEHVPIELNGEKIYLAGIENWGLPPFKQYGDLAKTMSGIPEDGFTILLSHNPDHWVKQVNEKTSIPLTLAGHTHGFQFGLEVGHIKLSPVRFVYKYWAGLYKSADQYLYVNRGLGYLSFSARVGIWPEITVLELKKS
ncbi:MAG: metallophosphoesterase [Bacteroidales bacterium]|nr:metallophosphoesterase [Bacteroidales bacterium]